MYSVHAYFRAIRSNRFKTVYQRCMLLQCFGSSDEASGEVGLGIFAQDVCVCVKVCVTVCVWMCIICFGVSQCTQWASCGGC